MLPEVGAVVPGRGVPARMAGGGLQPLHLIQGTLCWDDLCSGVGVVAVR